MGARVVSALVGGGVEQGPGFGLGEGVRYPGTGRVERREELAQRGGLIGGEAGAAAGRPVVVGVGPQRSGGVPPCQVVVDGGFDVQWRGSSFTSL